MRISDWSSDVCSSDLVAPGTHQGLPWNIDCLNRLEHGADIGSVGPAADGVDRALDAAEVGDRPLSPEVTVGLVLQDCDDERLQVLQALQTIGRASCRERGGQYG